MRQDSVKESALFIMPKLAQKLHMKQHSVDQVMLGNYALLDLSLSKSHYSKMISRNGGASEPLSYQSTFQQVQMSERVQKLESNRDVQSSQIIRSTAD